MVKTRTESWRMNQNKKADALSKMASITFEHLTKEVLVEVLTKRSIEEKEVLKVDTQERKSWMDPIHEYLLSGLLPEDTREVKKIRIQAPQYKLIQGNLYKREVAIQDCEKCKEQSAIRKARTSGAIAAGIMWPFSHWGIHIIGPLPMAPGGLQFLAIAVEHSTKWVEAKPLTTINGRQVEKFVLEYVGWVDNLAKTLWIHRTLPRNNEKETPFSLTYGSEVVIPIIETIDDRGRVQKATKGKERKEVDSIENAYYQNKLRKYHNTRSSHPMYIVGDFVLLKQKVNEWQGPYIINEIHKGELYRIVDAADHSLVQTTKGTSLRKFYM
ncbi:reverse transcriptase domain-containing protein [Tanacetum coccineum]